jgi:peptide/nickel transport system permease protein
MFAYAVRRLLQFIPTILVITLIIFMLLNVLPGNAALMAVGQQDRDIDIHYIEMMKKDWGLDKPLWLRYVTYIKDLATGNLGLSFLRREPVTELVLARMWPTLKLAIVAMLIAVTFGIPLGFFSALRQGRWLDTVTMMGAVSGVSMPQFWLGLLLMFFSPHGVWKW